MIRVALQNPDMIESAIRKRQPKREDFRGVNLEAKVLTDEHYTRRRDDQPVFSNEDLNILFPSGTSQHDEVMKLLYVFSEVNIEAYSNGRQYQLSAKIKTNPLFSAMDVADLEDMLCFQDKKIGKYYVSGKFTKHARFDSDRKKVREGWKSYELEISLNPKPKEQKRSWNPFSRKKEQTQKPNYLDAKDKDWKYVCNDLAEFANVIEDGIHNVYAALKKCNVRVEEPGLDIQLAPKYRDSYQQVVEFPSFSVLQANGIPVYFFFPDEKGDYKPGDVASVARYQLRTATEFKAPESQTPSLEMTNRLLTYISIAKKHAEAGNAEKTMKGIPSIDEQCTALSGTYQTRAEVKKLNAYVRQEKAAIMGMLDQAK